MGLLGAISFSIGLVFLTQVPLSLSTDCPITSATPAGPSAILVKWNAYPGATNYFLDLRVTNNTNYAPVVVSIPATQTEKKVQGLRPGTNYTVALKVFVFYNVGCSSKADSSTVPDTAQITSGEALSSTSIALEWTDVPSADYYYLVVFSQRTGRKLNLTYTVPSAQVDNLQPSTNYDCYVYTANYAGLGLASKVKTITTLVQPPTGIKAVQSGKNQADISWIAVPDVLMYRVSVQEKNKPNAKPTVYNVTALTLHVSNILPCSEYLVLISSYNMFLVPSEPTVYSYTTNILNPVSTVSVDYTCSSGTVTVTWMPVLGADSYQAIALAEGMAPLTCNGALTSCQISGILCGKSYDVHVTPMSENCVNQVNATSASFQSVPCPPNNLDLLRTCDSEVILFSWDPTNNTQLYKATSIDSKGEVQECLTEDNSCYFTQTECGRHYYFTVFSMSGSSCNSAVSSSVDISTAPCYPTNVQTLADCNTNTLLSKWDLAEGALNYTVEAYGNVGNNSYYTCSTHSNSCSFQGIGCGESLTVYITSYDDQCSSPRTLAPVAETAPCVPANVAAMNDCEANSITVTWDISGSAIFYMVVAVDSLGNEHYCNTMDLECSIPALQCSTNYTVYVVASNLLCNSSKSNLYTVETVACPPSNIVTTLDCANNKALISWTAEPRIKSFTATLLDQNNGLLSCSSSTTSCTVTNLKCDQRYTVTVGNHDGICPSIDSQPVYMDSVHCGPSVNASVNCKTQVMTATWDAVIGADSYKILLSDGTTNMNFSITNHTFTYNELKCGKTYALDVSSMIAGCISRKTEVTVTQAPCVPTNVVAQTVCQQSFVDVTWQASLGAVSYEVTAVSSGGAPQLQCTSNGTSCQLKNLLCSQTYTATVSASDNKCYSKMSDVKQLVTEPCPPTGLVVSLNCANNSAMLTWHASTNAVSYTGTAVSTTGNTVTCDAGAGLGCQLKNLLCGQTYNFSVTALVHNCQSVASQSLTYSTAPCPITTVTNNVDCATNTLTTSWMLGVTPLNYTVIAARADGTTLVCQTNSSSCHFSNLPCGKKYTVTVTPVSNTCSGQSSIPQIVNTAPCLPTNLQGQIQCSDNTLHTSWTLAVGADQHVATLTGAGGFSKSCNSSDGGCSFPNLQCAQTYNLTVVGSNNRCPSSNSITVKSAPCDATNVSTSMHCDSGVATVSWTASAGANYYTVLAQVDTDEDSCGTTGTSCELSNLQCGQNYSVIVMAGDSVCNSSVLTTQTIITAPCAPVMKAYSLDCNTNNAMVPWVKDVDAHSVTVSAVTNQGHSVSCTSTNSSCELDALQCGSTYTVTAVAHGVQCVSEASVPFDIVTAPCTPENVNIVNSCETGIAIVSWDETLGRKTFYVTATSGTDVKTCSSSTTDCPLSSLLCGQLYNVNVFAIANHCNSSVPGVSQIQTAPCAPQNVSASLVCDGNTGSVSWTASPGAVSYKVKALSRNGDALECSSNTTTCDIPNMECAQTYRITVTPFSEACQGYDSLDIDYVAGPCPPTDITVNRQCTGNVGVVSWTAAVNGEHYVATAVETINHHTHNCSSDGTNCSITNLHCGETVSVTVVTQERGCWSQPSQPYIFEAVICPPTGLNGVTTCRNNDIRVSWQPSPKTGVTYYVNSVKFGGNATQFTTGNTSRVISGLHCGELYTLAVSAQYQECTSALSNSIDTPTAPCPPTGLSVKTDCGTSSGTLTWTASIGATHYTATFTGSNGHVTTCNTNTTTCTVNLDCGHQYNASLIASSATCDSSTASTLVFNAAPCLPDNVAAILNCAANSFSVSWDGHGNGGPYTALGIGSDGSRVSCNTSNTQCTITSLKCGLLYSIVVTTADVDCGVIKESNYKMQSAPCKPTAVSLNLDCKTNVAVVSWQSTGPDQTQEVVARDIRGNTISCNSSTLQCTFSELTCGLSYNISVIGKSATCTTSPTYGPMLHTAPCVATHVRSSYDCDTGITLVTWDAGLGATSYLVDATGNLGYDDQCENTDTNCAFPTLACGQDYNITVQARNSQCISAVSETVVTTSGPCPHSNVATNLDCSVNTAVVSWTPGSGILYYNATATAFNTDSTASCSSPDSSCNITTMLCGESYMIDVAGQGLHCPSPSQSWQRLQAAPCPPHLVSVNSSCDASNITVHWETSKGAVSYRATAENEAGQKFSCDTDGTSCQIASLPCGQQFTVYVSGVDGNCMGARSNVQVIQTAPCVPQNVRTQLDCPTGFLNVTWDTQGRLPKGIIIIITSDGTIIIIFPCKAADGHCGVPGIPCGKNYNVKLVAQEPKCNSSFSTPLPLSTAPCPLPTFDAIVDCNTGAMNVTWANGVAGALYSVVAIGPDSMAHTCNSSHGGCGLNTLACGTEYSVTITPSRDGCVGRSSAPQVVTTVPCVPQLKAVEIDCLTNSAWVMGTESMGAEDYVITATDSAGGVQTFECNSTLEDMCFLPPLACSMNFTFTVQARDAQCSSAHSNAVLAETGPCSPLSIVSHADCDVNTITIEWAAVPGAVSYTATLEDFNGNTTCCTSSHNSCDIRNLPCGQMYILLVTSEGRTCNSSESREMARTAPCVPENLEYSLSCSTNLASMMWNHSLGGQLYQVTAISEDNLMDQCSGHENNCDLTNLQCGQVYNVTVTAEDMDCASKPSESVTIKTAPCTPEDLSPVMDCVGNMLLISWTDSPGADSYLATVEDSYGQQTSCQATTEGTCSVGNLGCGLIYHVSLVASDGYCDSLPTDVVDAPSGPCEPKYIKAVFDCQTGTALVSWYPSDGALFYIAKAGWAGDATYSSKCETNQTYCELDGLECGKSYSVDVMAMGENCNITGYMDHLLGTGPCVLDTFTTEYSFSIGQVMWDKTLGADHYSVEAVTEQGLVSLCETNDTYCPLYNMQCSQTYTVTVTTHNNVCPKGSVSNVTQHITTEPCPPQHVQASVQGETNLATVTWEPSEGALSYEVSLSGRNGQMLDCETTETFCESHLECGVIYYVRVIAIGDTLNSTESETINVAAAPCVVGGVAASVDHHNNSASITWVPSAGAESYEMIATATSGQQDSCESSGSECELLNLECGQNYSIKSVTISEPFYIETATGVTFKTRPCKPQNIGVDFQSTTRTATLYWEVADGVDLYNATAVSSTGVTTYCTSTSSTCNFTSLDCGETYQFNVKAMDDGYCSEMSDTVEIHTGPCQPTGLIVQGSCDSDTVKLSWSAAKGALLYTVRVTGDLGFITSLQTANTSINIDLLCGQLYTFTVQAQDDTYVSAVSSPAQHRTGPCVPFDVQSYTHCENNMGAVSWAPSDGAEYYIAFAVGENGDSQPCTTNTTSCTWPHLHCAQLYTIHVTAHNDACDSHGSNSTTLRTAPCIPQNVLSTFNCSMKVGTVSWDLVDSAAFYIVTAESNSGHKIPVSTNETSAYISEFMCGQEYFLSVQSVDPYCTSAPSNTTKLQSEPCPPTNVTSFMNCMANIAVVMWSGSSGADYYTATVTPEDGTPLSCWQDKEQCGIPNLRCGQDYTVSVVAHNEACNSDPSEPSQLRSVPCVPTNVTVDMDCANNQAVVTWDASQGAIKYQVTAQDDNGTMSFCETSGLSCRLDDLDCGETYTVQVVAMDEICSSLPSPATLFDSVPCIPEIGTVVIDCVTNSALVDWTLTEGAANFSATAISANGHSSTCSTNYTSCELEALQCGHSYSLTVKAMNGVCESPPSYPQQFNSVPCPPHGLTSSLDCTTNSINAGWQVSPGADYYIVEALGVEEDNSSCSSASNSCVLENLLCGFIYNISVTAVNEHCNISSSPVIQQKSVPCVPDNVRAVFDCEHKDVQVTWETSQGALSYTTVALGSGGFSSDCATNDTWCMFDDLACGMNYTITVLASDHVCSSPTSEPVEINTGLCEPQGAVAQMMCNNNTALVSWEAGEDVFSYTVKGRGPDGHNVSCNTVETSCKLPNMHCGQKYNLTVTANDGRCDNSQAHLSVKSVPCSPTKVGASLVCHLNSVAVTWEPASGASSYVAVGVSSNGAYTSQCTNNQTFCDLSDLMCGTVYNVTVFGKDNACSSVKSTVASVHTAPCAPQDVAIVDQCASRSFSVSWSPNPDAQYFHAVAVSASGVTLKCNTTSTSCSFSGLPCGQTYNVSVISVRGDCESVSSAWVQTSSAPCVPTNIKGSLDCVSNSAWITWDTTQGAQSYFVWAQALRGNHNSSCTSPTSPCSVPDLKCGTVYNITVTANNAHCSSAPSTKFRLETAPCALTEINAVTQCDSSVIMVEWQISDSMDMYVATAEGQDQSQIMCNSTANWCELTNAACGMHYTIIVSTSSDKCSSLRSPPHKIDTVPCPPQNVTAVQSCKNNGVTVSYQTSVVATQYMVEVSSLNGYSTVCESTSNNCTVSYLPCGKEFEITVYALSDNCTSPGTTILYESGPCAPLSLDVVYDCNSHSALVSWSPSAGTTQYFASAQSLALPPLYCTNTIPSCTIEGLQCGNMYNFTVESSNNICNSSGGATVEVGAVPCAPTNVQVRIQKIEDLYWVMISWDRVVCPDVEYQANIVGYINNNPQTVMEISSYWLERNYYETPLPTGSTYNIKIYARNEAGVSAASNLYTGVTVPSPPQNVVYHTQTSQLTWNASVLANHYTVYQTTNGVKTGLCETALLTCTAPGVDPSSIAVTASNSAGTSTPSVPTVTANRRRRSVQSPRPLPEMTKDDELEVPDVEDLSWSGKTLYVEWTQVSGAAEYILVLYPQSRPTHSIVHIVEDTYYKITDLDNSTSYCVRVAARNISDQSSFSKVQCITA